VTLNVINGVGSIYNLKDSTLLTLRGAFEDLDDFFRFAITSSFIDVIYQQYAIYNK
jgi:hypothetical protein